MFEIHNPHKVLKSIKLSEKKISNLINDPNYGITKKETIGPWMFISYIFNAEKMGK